MNSHWFTVASIYSLLCQGISVSNRSKSAGINHRAQHRPSSGFICGDGPLHGQRNSLDADRSQSERSLPIPRKHGSENHEGRSCKVIRTAHNFPLGYVGSVYQTNAPAMDQQNASAGRKACDQPRSLVSCKRLSSPTSAAQLT